MRQRNARGENRSLGECLRRLGVSRSGENSAKRMSQKTYNVEKDDPAPAGPDAPMNRKLRV